LIPLIPLLIAIGASCGEWRALQSKEPRNTQTTRKAEDVLNVAGASEGLLFFEPD